MPTCFGPTHRVVLDHLGRRHGRHFANPRDFVEFARAVGPDLDFTTPPTRPAAGARVGSEDEDEENSQRRWRLSLHGCWR